MVGLVALLAASVSFLRGTSWGNGRWRPAWRWAVVVLPVALGGYAWGAASLASYLEIDLRDPRVSLSGWVGEGGRYAFLNVGRGALWGTWSARPGRSTPYQPWIVDLEEGTARPVGSLGDYFLPDRAALRWMNAGSLSPLRYVFCQRSARGTPVTWFDGRTAQVVHEAREVIDFGSIVAVNDGRPSWNPETRRDALAWTGPSPIGVEEASVQGRSADGRSSDRSASLLDESRGLVFFRESLPSR